jgi:hypothetical protein
MRCAQIVSFLEVWSGVKTALPANPPVFPAFLAAAKKFFGSFDHWPPCAGNGRWLWLGVVPKSLGLGKVSVRCGLQPKLDRQRLLSLYDSFDYIRKKQNLIWLGPTGCGKTGLASALLLQAIDRGYRGYFVPFAERIGRSAGLLLRSPTASYRHMTSGRFGEANRLSLSRRK